MAEQTLRPYNQTWADKLSSYLYDMTSKSPEARNFVGGLMGGTGLGRTQMGLVDATPLGVPLQMQESYQAGDAKGMAMAALPMPVKAGMGMVKRAAEEVAPAIERGIIAYHGSPHSFDRFDISKIGTGEGAQAYGHGLYFADSEPVAKAYRDALFQDNLNDVELDAFQALTAGGWDQAAAHKNLDERVAQFQANKSLHPADTDYAVYNAQKEEARRLIDQWSASGGMPQDKRGSMYQVRINADPEHFLDWDKPLSEQPEVAKRLGYSPRSSDEIHTEAEQLFAKHGQYPNMPPEIKQRIEELQNELDSRVPNITGEQLYTGRGENDYLHSVLSGQKFTPEQSAELKAKGIPGIKYLDQGSRAAGDGSRNYVVFDDKLIEILKKYGLAGLLAGGGGMGMMQPKDAQAQTR